MKKTYQFKLCWRYLISAVVLLFCCSIFNNSYAQTITVDGYPGDWEHILNNPVSVKAVSFVVDVKKLDGTDNQFTTGAKDYSAAPDMGWSWSQVNDKNELTNAAVAIIEEEGPLNVGIEKHMYFFTDRFSTNGSAEVGFWVFQNGTAPREPEMDFSPEKTVGDLLILATFTNGGAVDNIELYQWKYPDSSKEGKFEKLTSTPGVNACAYVSKPSVNHVGALQNAKGVWYYPLPAFAGWEICNKEAKDCDNYYDGAFFEGCINLTWLEQQGFLPIKLCGGTFLMETRESHKLSSAVNDFIGGSLNYEFEITAEGDKVCVEDEPVTVTLCALNKDGLNDFLEGTTFKWYASEDNALNDENVLVETRCYSPQISVTTPFWVVGTDPDGCASAPVMATGVVYDTPVPTANPLMKCEVLNTGKNTFNLTDAIDDLDGGEAGFYNGDGTGPIDANVEVTIGESPKTFVLRSTNLESGELNCYGEVPFTVTVYNNPAPEANPLMKCEVLNTGANTFVLTNAIKELDGGVASFYNSDGTGPIDPNVEVTIAESPKTFILRSTNEESGDLDCNGEIPFTVTVYNNPAPEANPLMKCEVLNTGANTFVLTDAIKELDGGVASFYNEDGTGPIDPNVEVTIAESPKTFILRSTNTESGDLNCNGEVPFTVTVYNNPAPEAINLEECEIEYTGAYTFDLNDAIKELDEGIASFYNPGEPDPIADPEHVEVTIAESPRTFILRSTNAESGDLDCHGETEFTVIVNYRPVLVPEDGEACVALEGPTDVVICVTGKAGELLLFYDNPDLIGSPIAGLTKVLIEGEEKYCPTVSVSETASYWVTSTSENGCVSDPVKVTAIVLPNPTCDNIYGGNSTNETGNNGWATVEASGGTGTLLYSWTTLNGTIGSDPTLATITGLTKGLYTVRITDEKGCWTECEYEILSNPVCEVEGSEVDCFGNTDGTVKVSWVQGTAPFDVYLLDELDNVLMSAMDVAASPYTFLNVPVGTNYFARVVDDDGLDTDCGPVDVVQPPLLECEVTPTSNADCDMANGTAAVTILKQLVDEELVWGGTPPYRFKKNLADPWSDWVEPENLPFAITGLAAGTHTIYAEDWNHCPTDCDVTIEENPCATCQTAYGYGGDDISYSFDEDCLEGGTWDNWGWSIHIPTIPGTGSVIYEVPMYAGAPTCDPSPNWDSHIVDIARVEVFADGHLVVTLPELYAGDGWTLESSHIWVSETGPSDRFPDKIAPGSWGGMVAGDEIPFTGGYIIVHGVYCGPPLQPVVEPKAAKIKTPDLVESALKVYPNPFSDKVTFEFVSGKDAYGVLDIFNITGQKVARILDRQVESGVMNRIEYVPLNKVSGIYIYRLDLDGTVHVGRVIYKE